MDSLPLFVTFRWAFQLRKRLLSIGILVWLLGTCGASLCGADPPVTDDFNSVALNTRWKFADPVGNGSFSLSGSNLLLNVPAGSNHDPAFGGANNAVRLLQNIANADFAVTVKFDSIPTAAYQFEGILVEQDSSNYLRFQFGSTGSSLIANASTILSQNETPVITSAVSPGLATSLWLKVERSGNTWTQSWSADGSTYNNVGSFIQPLTTANIGPFAGNYSAISAPAFTASIDYFNSGAPPDQPAISAHPASDDFQGSTLNTALWTFLDPLGDRYSLTGTNLLISVQGGVTHDPIASGVNYSTRIVQSTPDVDFDVEVKFDSVPNQTGTEQGILVEQDGANFLRFEFQGSGGGTNLFAGAFIGNAPSTIHNSPITVTGHSLWIRVIRSASDWAVSWSPDGINFNRAVSFTQHLAVSHIGVMAGNSGDTGRNTPDFTASVDYFFNMSSPIASPNGGSPAISNLTAIPGFESVAITWNTDENATSRVDIGSGIPYGKTQSDPAMVSAHSILITGLACATSYHYAVTAVSSSGASRQSPDFIVTTPACGAVSIPISDSFDTTSLNASVWTLIDPVGDSHLAFNGSTAQLTVPSRSAHNPWSLTGNASPRIVQHVSDSNFDVAAKFVSPLEWDATGQGIVVEQDALHYLLFELRSEGNATSVWVGSRAGAAQKVLLNSPFHGYAPLWLRVTRSGINWTVSWSLDGNTYSQAGNFEYSLAATTLGLYVTNNAPTRHATPALTASVDSFMNLAAPVNNRAARPPFARIVIDPDPGTVLVEETMGDLDGDGRPDAIIGFSDQNRGIVWYRSPHSGTLTDKWDRFIITPSGQCYEDVTVVDVNGDGAKDVIASIDNMIKWYENPLGRGGNSTTDPWTEHIISSNAPGENNFILVDIDGDGQNDIVTPRSIYFRSGPDSWKELVYNNAFRGVTLMDIGSGKGAINIAGTSPNEPFSFVWYENPRENGGDARTGQWISHFIGPAYDCSDPGPACFGEGSVANLAAGDLNGDGRMDMVSVQSEGYPFVPPGGTIWWEAPADRRNGTWVKHTIDATFQGAHNVLIADMDKNGTLDVIAAEQEHTPERRVSIFLNDGKGNFSQQVLSNSASHNPFVIDINGDGWLDMFSANHGRWGVPNPLELYINPGQ
jgi:regulation of enolase protein 1 (concanavalin A-like superfamily)